MVVEYNTCTRTCTRTRLSTGRCHVLTVLEHEEESLLGNVTFESLVSTLPLGVGYSRVITTGLDGMWGHDESGDSHEPHGNTTAHTGGAQVATVHDDTFTGQGDTEMDL